MAVCETKCEAVIRLDQEVTDLKGWQKSQNGAIHRVEEKVDKLQFWMMTAAGGIAISFVTQLLFFLLKKG
ncbi:MAG: hypothetical protein M0021_09780 [Clostridia bacterium]|nr:hypothetical protein [Clostridia bacterium]